MGILVTLAVSIVILAVVARILWPRNARAPLPLYAGTIFLAFFVGSFAGQVAEGRTAAKALESAGLISPLILIVALISWFRVGSGGAGQPPQSRTRTDHVRETERPDGSSR